MAISITDMYSQFIAGIVDSLEALLYPKDAFVEDV